MCASWEAHFTDGANDRWPGQFDGVLDPCPQGEGLRYACSLPGKKANQIAPFALRALKCDVRTVALVKKVYEGTAVKGYVVMTGRSMSSFAE